VSKPVVQSRSTVRPLDRNGFIPLYFQIQRALRENIHSGELSEGDALASEEELARTYQVSRTTARQALHGLKTSGYAYSQKGRGTFVTRPKLEKNIMHLMGFTKHMKQGGMVPSSRVLEQLAIKATKDLAQKLKVAIGEPVLRLRRLRLADRIPMALEESHIPLKFFPGLERISCSKQSVYHILRENYGVRVAWADEVIEASACHTRRVGAVYDSKEGQCVIDLADHHDYGRDADRGRLLAVSWRPLSCFSSRPDYNDRIASSAIYAGLA
jgi:GntR family transcriptional regulator